MLFVRLHTGIHKNKYVSDKNVRKDTQQRMLPRFKRGTQCMPENGTEKRSLQTRSGNMELTMRGHRLAYVKMQEQNTHFNMSRMT